MAESTLSLLRLLALPAVTNVGAVQVQAGTGTVLVQ